MMSQGQTGAWTPLLPRLFLSAGDIVKGASLVVWAIRDGRDAATEIEKYLQLKATKSKSEEAA